MFTSAGTGLEMPMVVLQNAGTTGPAELFAQALKDYGVARGVGAATAGKGVILELLPLVDGSAIEITVALLVSPSGVIFNGTGVRADYDVSLDGNWRNLDEATDPQLRKAIELAIALHRVDEALEQQAQQGQQQEGAAPEMVVE